MDHRNFQTVQSIFQVFLIINRRCVRPGRKKIYFTVNFFSSKMLSILQKFFFNLHFLKYSNGNNTVLKTTLKAAFSSEYSEHNNKRSFRDNIAYYEFFFGFDFTFLRFGFTRSNECAPLGRVPKKKKKLKET